MIEIPQCMRCKNVKIENETIICPKYQIVPEKIENGTERCKYYERNNKGTE